MAEMVRAISVPVWPTSWVQISCAEKMTGQRSGECEFRRVRLPDPLAVEGAGHGINQVAHQQSVKFVAAVERGDKIEVALVDGTQQALDPLGLDGGGFGRDHGTSGDAQKFGRSQNGAQRGAGRRASGIFRADAVQGAQGVQVSRVLQVVDGSAADQIRSLIARATVGVDDDRAFAGKIFQQAGTDGLHHLTDGGGIVVGRHTDKNVRLTDVNQLAKKLIRKNAFLGQILPPVTVQMPVSVQSWLQILRRRNQ